MISSFKLISVLSIPIRINYSWFVIFFLVTIAVARYVFPELYPDWSAAVIWPVAVCTSLLFFLSLLAHEMAHSLVARKQGIEVRSITLFVFGGAARIAREPSTAGAELLMAGAGPLMSVTLGGFFALLWFLFEGVSDPLAGIAFYLCWINLGLAVFNMMPGFPMDGGRVLRAVIWWRSRSFRKSTRIASFTGRAFSYLLILGGVAIGFTLNWFNGIWMVFVGVFLNVAASTSYRQAMMRENLQGLTAKDIMSGNCRTVSPHLTIEELIEEYASPAYAPCLLVGEWNRLLGIATMRKIKQVAKRGRAGTTVSEVMTPINGIHIVSPDDDALSVVTKMEEGGPDLILVAPAGTVVGCIEQNSLLRFGRALS